MASKLKGRSRNSRGKPTLEKLKLGKILQSIDNEQMFVTIDGKRRRTTRLEIEFRQVFEQAIKGNLDAGRLIATLAAAKYRGPEPVGSGKTEFEVLPDEEYHSNYQARVAQNASQSINLKKQNLNAYDLFWKIALEKTTYKLEGVEVKMANIEAFIRKMKLLASSNVRAGRLIQQLRVQFPAPLPEENITFVVSETDSKL